MSEVSLNQARKISIAPMMDYTDRHFRYFMRLISKSVLLYTEMVVSTALVRGNPEFLLQYNPAEHPLALQVGGSDVKELVQCARLAEAFGFDEININVGCPSERVQWGQFGACLMAEPNLVAECVAAMQTQVKIPVTVKTRIGIDKEDSYDFLHNFVSTVNAAGCEIFIIHARKAWLKGLSPKENRSIPPLNYDFVYRLKKDFPKLNLTINGGITTLEQIENHLQYVDGVMIGREAYHNPYLLAEADARFFSVAAKPLSRLQVMEHYLLYVKDELKRGHGLQHLIRPILGLYHGVIGARAWRGFLSENAVKKEMTADILLHAMAFTEKG